MRTDGAGLRAEREGGRISGPETGSGHEGAKNGSEMRLGFASVSGSGWVLRGCESERLVQGLKWREDKMK